eukprot:TRINITY_DN1318_c0_g1_i1.p1 TRINITY_DN1318_c0_g1~~TRINITY_DN1318_c0_g1_i1.p1  ORF type:complete len:859 (+),score=303.52 TRINITY_DN1318_c0_g1_i1:87-2663(+)
MSDFRMSMLISPFQDDLQGQIDSLSQSPQIDSPLKQGATTRRRSPREEGSMTSSLESDPNAPSTPTDTKDSPFSNSGSSSTNDDNLSSGPGNISPTSTLLSNSTESSQKDEKSQEPNPNSSLSAEVDAVDDTQLSTNSGQDFPAEQQKPTETVVSSPPALDPSKVDKIKEMRRHAIMEIITSENQYVQDLATLIRVYMRPIADKSIIPPLAISEIFSNVETLFSVNLQILNSLEEALDKAKRQIASDSSSSNIPQAMTTPTSTPSSTSTTTLTSSSSSNNNTLNSSNPSNLTKSASTNANSSSNTESTESATTTTTTTENTDKSSSSSSPSTTNNDGAPTSTTTTANTTTTTEDNKPDPSTKDENTSTVVVDDPSTSSTKDDATDSITSPSGAEATDSNTAKTDANLASSNPSSTPTPTQTPLSTASNPPPHPTPPATPSSASMTTNSKIPEGVTMIPIGKIYSGLAPFLKLYLSYCDNYDHAMETLNKLQKKKPQLTSFDNETSETSECKGLFLKDFLIKPVQRLCKYPILFERLLEYTSDDNPDYQQISQTLKKIQEIAQDINKKSAKNKNFSTLVEIEARLLDYPHKLVSPGREFIKEGKVFKSSPGSSRTLQTLRKNEAAERLILLFSDKIIYAKDPVFTGSSSAKQKQIVFRGEYSLKNLRVIDSDPAYPEYDISFFLESKEKAWKLFFETPKEKTQWMKLLKNHCNIAKLAAAKDVEKTKQQELLKQREQLEESEIDEDAGPMNSPTSTSTTTISSSPTSSSGMKKSTSFNEGNEIKPVKSKSTVLTRISWLGGSKKGSGDKDKEKDKDKDKDKRELTPPKSPVTRSQTQRLPSKDSKEKLSSSNDKIKKSS